MCVCIYVSVRVGADKKTSVLDYVVKNMREKGEDKIIEVTDDLQIVESAFEMSGLSIEQSANDLLLQVTNLKAELRDAEAMVSAGAGTAAAAVHVNNNSHPNDGITQSNEHFIKNARKHVTEMDPYIQRISSNLSDMKASAVDLSHYFGHGDGIDDTDTTEIITALKKLRQAIVTSRYIVTGEQRSTSWKMPTSAPPNAPITSTTTKTSGEGSK